MAINITPLLDALQAKLASADSDTALTDINTLNYLATYASKTNNVIRYPKISFLNIQGTGDSADSYTGDFGYDISNNKYYFRTGFQWNELTLNDSAAVYQGPSYQGTVEGYSSGGNLNPGGTLTAVRYSNSFANDAVITGGLPQLQTAVGSGSSPSNSDTRSYVVSSGPAAPSSIIQSFDFASQTTQVDTGTLVTGKYNGAGNSSKLYGYGYQVGGSGTSTTIPIQRYTFASNVTSVVEIGYAYTSADPRTWGSFARGLNSIEKGYVTGGNLVDPGVPTWWGGIVSYPFTSNVPGSVITTDLGPQPLTPEIRGHGAWSTLYHGYVGGGRTPTTALSTLHNKFPFSSETYIAMTSTVSSRAQGANYNDANAGYMMGGLVNAANGYLNGTTKYIFASETYSQPAGTLPGPTLLNNTGNHQ